MSNSSAHHSDSADNEGAFPEFHDDGALAMALSTIAYPVDAPFAALATRWSNYRFMAEDEDAEASSDNNSSATAWDSAIAYAIQACVGDEAIASTAVLAGAHHDLAAHYILTFAANPTPENWQQLEAFVSTATIALGDTVSGPETVSRVYSNLVTFWLNAFASSCPESEVFEIETAEWLFARSEDLAGTEFDAARAWAEWGPHLASNDKFDRAIFPDIDLSDNLHTVADGLALIAGLYVALAPEQDCSLRAALQIPDYSEYVAWDLVAQESPMVE